jgi:hypothetical protein
MSVVYNYKKTHKDKGIQRGPVKVQKSHKCRNTIKSLAFIVLLLHQIQLLPRPAIHSTTGGGVAGAQQLGVKAHESGCPTAVRSGGATDLADGKPPEKSSQI